LSGQADEELGGWVARARRRDPAAFAAVIRRTERTALAVAFAVVGEATAAGDVVQEAFLKAWQKLAELDDVDRFLPWLCGIVRNAAVDQRRRHKISAGPTESETPSTIGDPTAGLVREEQSRQIDAALASLDELSRSAVVLRYYENLSSRQIGELLGLSAAAVDMRLSRARQELKAMLGDLWARADAL
jgi:RNA polymerase sigma factor (sigma-70 family)